MPLIAMDILEEKVKELLLAVNHLNAENAALKAELQQLSENSSAVSPDVVYQLESLQKTVEKYKQERSVLYAKISRMLEQLKQVSGGGKEDDNG